MPSKKDILRELLARTWVYLQVDGTHPGVDLPDWLRNPTVTLQIGYGMAVPIPDLSVEDDGVVATLSFRRVPHTCRLPWSAIYAMSDGEGQGLLFPDDVPPSLREAIAAISPDDGAEPATTGAPAATAEASPQPGVPVPFASDAQVESPAPQSVDEAPNGRFRNGRPRPSHLKLV